MKALTIRQPYADAIAHGDSADVGLPATAKDRRWIPGHRHIRIPRGDSRAGRLVVAGWQASCKCGWYADSPSRSSSDADAEYRTHFLDTAARITAQRAEATTPKSKAKRAKGHASTYLPLGQTRGKLPIPEGWQATCRCGWRTEEACANRTVAESAYRSHLDDLVLRSQRICSRCKQVTQQDRMSKGSPHLCKSCRTATTREWAAAHPTEWERSRRKSHLKRAYGLTLEEAEALFELNGGCCAICGKPEGDTRGFRLHIDHDHETGKVRAILCNLCNAGLGNFRDDPDLMLKAIAYLAMHKEGIST